MSLQTLNLNLALTININKDGTATVSVDSNQPITATPAVVVDDTITETTETKTRKTKAKTTDKPVGKKDLPPPPPPVEPVIVTDEDKTAVVDTMAKAEQQAGAPTPVFTTDTKQTGAEIEHATVVAPAPELTPEQVEYQRKLEAAKKVFGNDPSLQTQRAPITPPPAPAPVTPAPVPPAPAPVTPAPVPPAPAPVTPAPVTPADYMPTPMDAPKADDPTSATRQQNVDMTMDSMWQELFGNPPDPNSI